MMLAVFLNFQFFIIFEKDLYKKNKICSFVTETIMKLCTADVLNMHMGHMDIIVYLLRRESLEGVPIILLD